MSPEYLMKSLHIFALHLAYGGVEKAVSEFSNIMAEKYDVTIHSVYKMPDSPAYPIDSRVHIRYLLDDIPNRKEFKAAVAEKNLPGVIKEGFRAVRILYGKRSVLIRAIREIDDEDHAYRKTIVRHFKNNYGNIDLLVLLSPKMVREVREIMKNNTHTHVAYVPNFLVSVPPETDPAHREKTVIAVGRLAWVKGFDRLIDLFARIHPAFPDWKLKIVGGGDEYDALRSRIDACNAASYITLTGKLAPSRVIAEMQRAAVYALSSYTESFPFVLLEAMSCSLPIAAFNTRGGLEMIVNDAENGFLAESDDAFLSALSRLMGDEELRTAMGKKSRELSSRYTSKAVAETWYQLIEDLYEEK